MKIKQIICALSIVALLASCGTEKKEEKTKEASEFNHFVEQNSNVKNPFVHILYVQKGEKGNLVNLTKKNYRTILKEMTAEYPELQARIGSRGHGFKHVSKIVSTYNAWMVNNGEEIVLGMK